MLEKPLVEIIVKYGVLVSEWGGLYYALLKGFINKIALWKMSLKMIGQQKGLSLLVISDGRSGY